jgi:hypothetical protein
MPRRARDERGVALPSPVALLSAAAVVLAGIAFVATSPGREAAHATKAAVAAGQTGTPMPTPTKTAPRPVIKKKHKPQIRRGDTYVEVYNNSGISGLAGRTADRISGAGWQVVGSDNWYGTIPSSTVYYPARLHAEAKLLAKDVGITRLKPAISPMRFDRLTVILTSDYQ